MNEFCWFVLTDVNKVSGQNKIPLFREIYFFNQFSGDILFSSLVSFALFVFLFFCLFVCFLKIKLYILIHIRLCGGWVTHFFYITIIYQNKTSRATDISEPYINVAVLFIYIAFVLPRENI